MTITAQKYLVGFMGLALLGSVIAAGYLDATVAEHLPLGKLGVAGVGANVFYYQQVTDDSGSGAALGSFKGRTVGVGPVVSLITRVSGKDLAAEVKWLPELDVEKRLKGDYVWFKVGMTF
jgi:hypothetical protein